MSDETRPPRPDEPAWVSEPDRYDPRDDEFAPDTWYDDYAEQHTPRWWEQ